MGNTLSRDRSLAEACKLLQSPEQPVRLVTRHPRGSKAEAMDDCRIVVERVDHVQRGVGCKWRRLDGTRGGGSSSSDGSSSSA